MPVINENLFQVRTCSGPLRLVYEPALLSGLQIDTRRGLVGTRPSKTPEATHYVLTEYMSPVMIPYPS